MLRLMRFLKALVLQVLEKEANMTQVEIKITIFPINKVKGVASEANGVYPINPGIKPPGVVFNYAISCVVNNTKYRGVMQTTKN